MAITGRCHVLTTSLLAVAMMCRIYLIASAFELFIYFRTKMDTSTLSMTYFPYTVFLVISVCFEASFIVVFMV